MVGAQWLWHRWGSLISEIPLSWGGKNSCFLSDCKGFSGRISGRKVKVGWCFIRSYFLTLNSRKMIKSSDSLDGQETTFLPGPWGWYACDSCWLCLLTPGTPPPHASTAESGHLGEVPVGPVLSPYQASHQPGQSWADLRRPVPGHISALLLPFMEILYLKCRMAFAKNYYNSFLKFTNGRHS
jgi:hypothetical protein